MKRIELLILGLIFTSLCFGQTVKLQVGTSIAHLDWKMTGVDVDPLYNESIVGYAVFAGIDYVEKKYFNLSSNLGFLRKGGKMELQLTDALGNPTGETIVDKAKLDYFSINTLIDLKYPIKEKFAPFISCGPRIDFLFNYSKQFDELEEIDKLNKIAFGLLCGGGLQYDLNKLQFGLRADYYFDFTKVAEWTIDETALGGEITTNVFTINFIFGIKL